MRSRSRRLIHPEGPFAIEPVTSDSLDHDSAGGTEVPASPQRRAIWRRSSAAWVACRSAIAVKRRPRTASLTSRLAVRYRFTAADSAARRERSWRTVSSIPEVEMAARGSLVFMGSRAVDHRVEDVDVPLLRRNHRLGDQLPARCVNVLERVLVVLEPMLLPFLQRLERGRVAEQGRDALHRLRPGAPRAGGIVGLAAHSPDLLAQLLGMFAV